MCQKLKIGLKFVISLVVMTIICTIVWQEFVSENLYDCTDDNMAGFLPPGDWVHSWDNHPIVSVDQVAHGRSMREPDEIKEGWSVTDLWYLWCLFFGISLIISILFAWGNGFRTFLIG
jgi:hypothetical protein